MPALARRGSRAGRARPARRARRPAIAPAQARIRRAMTFGASKPCAPWGSRNWPRLGSFQTVKLFTAGSGAVCAGRDVAARVAGRDGAAERAVVARVERRDARRPAAVGPGRRLHDREQDARALARRAQHDAVGRRPLVGGIAGLAGLRWAHVGDARPVDVVADDVGPQLARQLPGARIGGAQVGVVLQAELEPGGRRGGHDAERDQQRDEQPAHPGTVARMRRSGPSGPT